MNYEPIDSSQVIAKLIVDNANYLSSNMIYHFDSKAVLDGYIKLIELQISTNDTLYKEMKLKDDSLFDAVIKKAISFVRIYKSRNINNQLDRENIEESFLRLKDSYDEMMSKYPYHYDNTDLPF